MFGYRVLCTSLMLCVLSIRKSKNLPNRRPPAAAAMPCCLSKMKFCAGYLLTKSMLSNAVCPKPSLCGARILMVTKMRNVEPFSPPPWLWSSMPCHIQGSNSSVRLPSPTNTASQDIMLSTQSKASCCVVA